MFLNGRAMVQLLLWQFIDHMHACVFLIATHVLAVVPYKCTRSIHLHKCTCTCVNTIKIGVRLNCEFGL